MKKTDLNENSKETFKKNNINNINENIQVNKNKEPKNIQEKNNNNSDNDIINSTNKIPINSKIINEGKESEIEKKKQFSLEIKKYLNDTERDKEYMNILENNPEKLFEIINDRTIMLWQSVVYSFEATIIDCDADILTVIPERDDQQIIVNDSKRTRFRESQLIPGFKKILEELLTFYCNTKKINYKQGLNEIFGPLILIQYKMKKLKLVNIFNFGEAFIDKFLPNYFYEKELFSLKSSMSLFVLLLKYHEPSVYNYLDTFEILHELYAANWLLTLRAQKLNLDILYHLWDNLIKINDPLFIHFILVAIIKYKRELLINCDPNLLLKIMVNLTINSLDELKDIINIALELRNLTPYSFRILSNKIGFLKTNNKNVETNYQKYKPEVIPTMQVFPIEILYENYNNYIKCPDPECSNNLKNEVNNNDFSKNFLFYNNSKNNMHICEKCDMKIEKKNLNYVIIDLRLFTPSYFNDDDDFFKMGFVSGMMTIDKEELKSDNIDKLLSSRLLSIRGNNHIILMTSKTDYFDDFEQKYYSDSRSEIMKKKIIFGVIQAQKEEKKLNLEHAEKNLDLKEIYKLKEYDNLKKIMISMKKNNFPYVSYLEGGFEALHRESLNYNIDLVDHDKKKCKLCKKIRTETSEEKKYRKLNTEEKIMSISETLWKNNKVITGKEISSFFNHEKNVLLICSLLKFKNKFYHKGDIEIFIAILFDKNIIEIYKNDSKNEKSTSNYENDNINDKNYYNLGIKEKKKEDLILRLYNEIQFQNILKASNKKGFKNVIILKVKNNENENNNKLKLDDSFEIEIEFYSFEDSKTFMNSIKNIKRKPDFNLFS